MKPAAPIPLAIGPAGNLTEELHGLAVQFQDRPLRIGMLLELTEGRGLHLLLLLLALPFVTPLPMPGVSTPFGSVIALIGAGFALGRRIWMPRRILEWTVPPPLAGKLFRGVERAMQQMRRVLRPRLTFVVDNAACRRISGLLILVCGALMSLPIPFPLTDGFPAATVSLLAAGALARDGLFFLAGCGMFGFTLMFFAVVVLGSAETLAHFHLLFGGT